MRVEHRSELAGQELRILHARAEADEGGGIPEHGVTHVGIELVEVLVGEREPHPYLPHFRH